MDDLAGRSQVGLACTIPEGMKPGSDTANLAVLGYNPRQYYTGRSPLEALSIGVDMKEDDIALRTNLITLSEEEEAYEDKRILDHSSDEISTEDAAILLDAVRRELEDDMYHFLCGNQLPPSAHLVKGQCSGADTAPRCTGSESRRSPSCRREASGHAEKEL